MVLVLCMSHRYKSEYSCVVGCRLSFLDHIGQHKLKDCACLECGDKCDRRRRALRVADEVYKVRATLPFRFCVQGVVCGECNGMKHVN